MIATTLGLTAAGAFLNRLRGAAWAIKRFAPRPIPQVLLALPYALACMPPSGSWVAVPIVLVLTALAWSTGHGGFIDLGSWAKPRGDERLEFVIRSLRGHMPDYLYDALGLTVTGLAVTIPAGIALANPALALSGALKAPAYMLGWALPVSDHTAMAEWLTGALLFFALASSV